MARGGGGGGRRRVATLSSTMLQHQQQQSTVSDMFSTAGFSFSTESTTTTANGAVAGVSTTVTFGSNGINMQRTIRSFNDDADGTNTTSNNVNSSESQIAIGSNGIIGPDINWENDDLISHLNGNNLDMTSLGGSSHSPNTNFSRGNGLPFVNNNSSNIQPAINHALSNTDFENALLNASNSISAAVNNGSNGGSLLPTPRRKDGMPCTEKEMKALMSMFVEIMGLQTNTDRLPKPTAATFARPARISDFPRNIPPPTEGWPIELLAANDNDDAVHNTDCDGLPPLETVSEDERKLINETNDCITGKKNAKKSRAPLSGQFGIARFDWDSLERGAIEDALEQEERARKAARSRERKLQQEKQELMEIKEEVNAADRQTRMKSIVAWRNKVVAVCSSQGSVEKLEELIQNAPLKPDDEIPVQPHLDVLVACTVPKHRRMLEKGRDVRERLLQYILSMRFMTVLSQLRNGRTLIHTACFFGDMGFLRIVMEAGARPGSPSMPFYPSVWLNASCYESGWTPLQYAAVSGSLQTVEALLAAGACVIATTHKTRTWRKSNGNSLTASEIVELVLSNKFEDEVETVGSAYNEINKSYLSAPSSIEKFSYIVTLEFVLKRLQQVERDGFKSVDVGAIGLVIEGIRSLAAERYNEAVGITRNIDDEEAEPGDNVEQEVTVIQEKEVTTNEQTAADDTGKKKSKKKGKEKPAVVVKPAKVATSTASVPSDTASKQKSSVTTTAAAAAAATKDPVVVALQDMGFDEKQILEGAKACGGLHRATADNIVAWIFSQDGNKTKSPGAKKGPTAKPPTAVKPREQVKVEMSKIDKVKQDRRAQEEKSRQEAMQKEEERRLAAQRLQAKKEEQRRRNREWNNRQAKLSQTVEKKAEPATITAVPKTTVVTSNRTGNTTGVTTIEVPKQTPFSSTVPSISDDMTAPVESIITTGTPWLGDTEMSTVSSERFAGDMNDDATVSTLGSAPPMPVPAAPPGFGPSIASVPEMHPVPTPPLPWNTSIPTNVVGGINTMSLNSNGNNVNSATSNRNSYGHEQHGGSSLLTGMAVHTSRPPVGHHTTTASMQQDIDRSTGSFQPGMTSRQLPLAQEYVASNMLPRASYQGDKNSFIPINSHNNYHQPTVSAMSAQHHHHHQQHHQHHQQHHYSDGDVGRSGTSSTRLPSSLFTRSDPLRAESFERILEKSNPTPRQRGFFPVTSHTTSNESMELSLIESISTGETMIGNAPIWGNHSAPVQGHSSLLGSLINKDNPFEQHRSSTLLTHAEHGESMLAPPPPPGGLTNHLSWSNGPSSLHHSAPIVGYQHHNTSQFGHSNSDSVNRRNSNVNNSSSNSGSIW